MDTLDIESLPVYQSSVDTSSYGRQINKTSRTHTLVDIWVKISTHTTTWKPLSRIVELTYENRLSLN